MNAAACSPATSVVTEVDEYWSAPLDTRMEALGGQVHRRTRADFEDEQFAPEVQTWNDEMDDLDAEMQAADTKTVAKANHKARMEKIKNAMS